MSEMTAKIKETLPIIKGGDDTMRNLALSVLFSNGGEACAYS